jgi:deoxyribodipyrimidine photo-lyase
MATSSGATAAAAAAGPAPPPRRRLVAWLRSDLRVHDNAVLHEAASRVRRGEADEVLPVYVLDPRDFAPSNYGGGSAGLVVVAGGGGGGGGAPASAPAAAPAAAGIPKMGPYRAKFLLESLADLQRSLRALGSDLAVRIGPAEDVIPPLLLAGGAAPGAAVIAHDEVTSEEQRQQARVERALGRQPRAPPGGGAEGAPAPKVARLWGGATMYHPDDLPFAKGTMADLPDVFTNC